MLHRKFVDATNQKENYIVVLYYIHTTSGRVTT